MHGDDGSGQCNGYGARKVHMVMIKEGVVHGGDDNGCTVRGANEVWCIVMVMMVM